MLPPSANFAKPVLTLTLPTPPTQGKVRAVKRVKMSALHLWDKNPRTIKDKRFQALCKSLEDDPSFMDLRPILATKEGRIYAGNMRYRAAKHLGWEDIPAILSDIPEKLANERAIKDNNEFGEWNNDELATLLDEMEKDGTDISLLGLDDSIQKIIEQLNEADIVEDEAPPVPKEAKTKPGELYILGNHRLLCGDSTKIGDVERLMDGQKADMVFTDPPYNTGMTGEGKGSKTPWKGYEKKNGSTWLSHMFNDSYTPEEWDAFLSDVFTNYYTVTKGDAAFYVCIDWRRVADIRRHMEKSLHVSNVIVWDKIVHGLGSDYKYTYELIVVGKKGKPEIRSHTNDEYRDIWHIQRKVGKNEDHATAKPIELCARPIRHASKQDDIVLDLFGGSGSTLIACEQLNRKCYMMELDPKYCDVIVSRWEKLTGHKAVLQ